MSTAIEARRSTAVRRPASGAGAVVVGLGTLALSVVRSLAVRGVRTTAVHGPPRRRPGSYSRLCDAVFVDSLEADALADRVLALGRRFEEPPVLIPTTDADVLALSRRRDEFAPWFRFALPDHERLATLIDKAAFARFAAQHRLPVPATFVAEDAEAWERALDECRLPCVVKPRNHTDAWWRDEVGWNPIAVSKDRLAEVASRLSGNGRGYVVQEWVPGADDRVFFHLTYVDQGGTTLASYTGRKIRQWEPRTGSTSMAEPAELPEAEAETRRLWGLTSFRGLGSLEFKRDPRDGRLTITEPTVGRPDLQLGLATANGVNIVHRAYCDLVGVEPPPDVPPRRPARWVYLERDVRSLLHSVRRGELTWREALRPYRGRLHVADGSWRDPLPLALGLVGIRAPSTGG